MKQIIKREISFNWGSTIVFTPEFWKICGTKPLLQQQNVLIINPSIQITNTVLVENKKENNIYFK